MSVHFTIPGRPCRWERPAEFKGVRSTPKAMRAALRTIGLIARAAMRSRPPMTGALRLEVLCVYAVPASWPPAKREAALLGQVWKTSRPDFDNLVKLVSDACNTVVFGDDAQIARASIAKRYGMPERTEVRISAMEGLSDTASLGEFRAWVAERRGQHGLDLASAKACHSQSRKGG